MNLARHAWLSPTALALALALLPGCATLGGEDLALHGVELAPMPALPRRADWQLLVEEPAAAAPVSGPRIVLRARDGEYAVLPDVRWREPSPVLFQSLLVEAFERCECLAGVARTSAAMRGDFLMATELRAFELRDDAVGPPLAVAEVSVRLVRISDGRVAASRRFAQGIRAGRRDAAAGIQALGIALNGIVADTVRWAVSATSGSDPPSP